MKGTPWDSNASTEPKAASKAIYKYKEKLEAILGAHASAT
jgi:23S rRNA maturation mini-RNase III